MKNYVEAKNNVIPSKHSKNYPMVLYFTALWCEPCKKIAPVLESLIDEKKNVTFIKIDIDDNTEITSHFNINSVPTFIFIKEKGKVHRILNGSKENLLKEYISEL